MDFVQEDLYHNGGNDSADSSNSSAATGRQKHYKILKEEDIKHLQQDDISTLSDLLSVSRGVACSLLCQNNWITSFSHDQWFAAAAKAERNPDPAAMPPHGSIQLHLCNSCYKTTPSEKLVSASCSHLFCTDCWQIYIAEAVSAGDACLRLRCPDPGCRAAVTFDMVEKLASEGDAYRYDEYLRRSYVESSLNRKWCPGAGCDRAVEFDLMAKSERYDVVCDCSHKFCWKCGVEWHSPVDCEAATEWVERNRSDAESTMWILDNTKPCPKCGRPIEESIRRFNMNYTMCEAPCSFEFCWVCSAPWKGKGGGCYGGCHKYLDDSRTNKAKRFSDRYVHCYERWDFNDELMKRAMEDLEEARMRYSMNENMQVVVQAWKQIVEGLRVLKWSYVYGYSLSSEGGKAKLLEHLQSQAEETLERLQHCVEKGVRSDVGFDVDCKEFREFLVNLSDLISLTRIYFGNLVTALENDLAEVEDYSVKNDLAREVESSAPISEKENEIQAKGKERSSIDINDIFFSLS